MNKIFKYDLYQRDNKWFFMGPKDVIVIRTDEVHDDFYDGIFCWCIVDPDDKEMIEHETIFSKTSFDYPGVSKKIGFIEEQLLLLPKKCSIQGIVSRSGFMNLHYHGNYLNGIKSYKLILRKTGQEIGYPRDKITYIGFGSLFIKQELAVYGFIVGE